MYCLPATSEKRAVGSGGFFRLLQVATPCGLLGASEIQGFPREFARFMDGPDLQDIRRGQHGICIESGESHAMGAHIERKLQLHCLTQKYQVYQFHQGQTVSLKYKEET